ncbi:uncharacterized protein METZ01_LOCUS108114, partial [marine metagenome]
VSPSKRVDRIIYESYLGVNDMFQEAIMKSSAGMLKTKGLTWRKKSAVAFTTGGRRLRESPFCQITTLYRLTHTFSNHLTFGLPV